MTTSRSNLTVREDTMRQWLFLAGWEQKSANVFRTNLEFQLGNRRVSRPIRAVLRRGAMLLESRVFITCKNGLQRQVWECFARSRYIDIQVLGRGFKVGSFVLESPTRPFKVGWPGVL